MRVNNASGNRKGSWRSFLNNGYSAMRNGVLTHFSLCGTFINLIFCLSKLIKEKIKIKQTDLDLQTKHSFFSTVYFAEI